MLFYMPLESYKERYTMQWSAPETGWLERNWRSVGFHYTRIDGDATERTQSIKTGSVVDGIGRSRHCFSQVQQILTLAEQGCIDDKDVIYFDDFWHPGIEALPYAFHLLGIKPKMYAFLHAQSVDEFDFTYPMRGWMRHFEKGIGEVLDGIFVCGPCLKDLVVFGGIAPAYKVHTTGHPFSSDEVLERMPGRMRVKRLNNVVFSSRWDNEKNPEFFLKVAEEVILNNTEAAFTVCTSAEKLRSNDERNLILLQQYMAKFPDNIFLKEGLTKEEYYQILSDSKIQMNTADQDFVAITLLEASVAGCYPIYPYFRSFPETFEYQKEYMYPRLDVMGAAEMVLDVLEREDLWDAKNVVSRSWIHDRFDISWKYMLHMMYADRLDLLSGEQAYAITDYVSPWDGLTEENIK